MTNETPRMKPGTHVKAFHPAKFGVIDYGTVVKNGSKYVRIDFGELHGGVFRVPHAHVVEVVEVEE